MRDMDTASLAKRYAAGETPSSIAPQVHSNASSCSKTFLAVTPLDKLLERCEAVENVPPASRGPVWGLFFAVKDNIDVAGLPTTAACPDYTYVPTEDAPTVKALIDGGAICVGKTNMDQFAAGLNGTRSPSGCPPNAVDAKIIPGGSSSGSASAVAAGWVTFALGTDTAGSGRVPAGLQGIVGIKPSVGLLSTAGVVPACASLDCVSVFATTVSEGAHIAREMVKTAAFPSDPTVLFKATMQPIAAPASFTFAVPDARLLNFAGPRGEGYAVCCKAAFDAAVAKMESMGGKLVQLDFAPLCDIAKMLYETSFVAERYAGIESFLDSAAKDGKRSREGIQIKDISDDARLLPVTRAIINGAGKFSAVDLYRDLQLLRSRRAACKTMLQAVDFLVVPTVMHHYLVSEVEDQEGADPPTWPYNSHLGTFTNFVNLVQLCGVSVPAGSVGETGKPAFDAAKQVQDQGLKMPFGVTILGHGQEDEKVWSIAQRFQEFD